MIDKTPAKIFGIGCFLQLLILIGLIWFVVWGIGMIQSKLDENGTTFFEQVGRDLKDIGDEYEKGRTYVDSTAVDSLKIEEL